MTDARTEPKFKPFVYVTVQGARLKDMQTQATADIKELLDTEHVIVGCQSARAIERIDAAGWAASKVAVWEAEFHGGFDYAAMTSATPAREDRA